MVIMVCSRVDFQLRYKMMSLMRYIIVILLRSKDVIYLR